MSFNIRYGTAPDGNNRWANRKHLVIDRIRAFHPDLLGVQECRDDQQTTFLKSALPDYTFIGVHRGGPQESAIEMAPILYKKDSFREMERGWFWLSQTPEVAGSTDWGSAFPRTVTWVKLQPRQFPDNQLFFINTHFDYISSLSIEESAKVLRRQIDELGQIPLILTGDFNTVKDGAAFKRLTNGAGSGSRPLIDAHHHLRPEDGPFHGFGQMEAPIPIDWILVSQELAVVKAEIDRFQEHSLYPSDHYPIHAILSFQSATT